MGYNLDVKKMSKEDWSLANCKERAIYIITNYSKTEKQLRDKLKKGGKYTDEIIDETIKFLKKHNFINDEDFAKRFVELHKNTYSIKVLKQKLYQKGIKRNIIDNLFDSEEVEFDEESIIKKLLIKKCPDYYEREKDMDQKERQKILAYLYRKGFSYDKIADIMKCNS
ncbi:MAG: regulatory protein RecX [Lachnospiraceae bacterium]|nr:regulatory protein RecX [Lachnospiraceae bacterium]